MKKLFVILFACCLLFGMTSCVPKTAADGKSKLADKEYTVVVDDKITPAALKIIGIGNVDSVLTATKKAGDAVESVTAIYFADNKSASDSFDKVKDYYKEKGEKVENIKKSGKVIYFGTEQGMKDFN